MYSKSNFFSSSHWLDRRDIITGWPYERASRIRQVRITSLITVTFECPTDALQPPWNRYIPTGSSCLCQMRRIVHSARCTQHAFECSMCSSTPACTPLWLSVLVLFLTISDVRSLCLRRSWIESAEETTAIFLKKIGKSGNLQYFISNLCFISDVTYLSLC